MMRKYVRLFWEFFKIALFVVGGGYAIIVVADDVFGRRLKWLREGELLDHLPIFQMVPGLIAGNTAIYTGLKIGGRLGAVVALTAVALPSFAIFLGVSCGYALLPTGNPWVESAMLGLRAALTGIVFGTLVKGWRRSVVGVYGYVTVVVAAALLVGLGVNVVAVLLAAMTAGIAWAFAGGAMPARGADSAGVALAPLARGKRIALAVGAVAALALVTLLCGRVFWTFVKFGLLGFGGGFVLVPVYLQEFVGPAAPLLQLTAEEFSNLMALTQVTPGPVSVNAATFFGYRLAGVVGAAVATAALLLPSLVLLTFALTGIEHWKRSRFVQGLLWGVRPATNALMLKAGLVFAAMSVVTWPAAQPATFLSVFHPFPCALALFAGWALVKGRLSIMAAIFLCAGLGAAGHLVGL